MTIKLTQQQLERFKDICHRRGIQIDDAKAKEQALKLLQLIALTRKSPPLKNLIQRYES